MGKSKLYFFSDAQEILLELDQEAKAAEYPFDATADPDVEPEEITDPCGELLRTANNTNQELDVYLMLNTCFGPQRLGVVSFFC